MIPDALTKLKISDFPLEAIKHGQVLSCIELPDWNIKMNRPYNVHWGEKGPYIYSSKPWVVDRLDLWTLDDKLKYFTWIQ